MDKDLKDITKLIWTKATELILEKGSLAMTYFFVYMCECDDCKQKQNPEYQVVPVTMPDEVANSYKLKLIAKRTATLTAKETQPIMVCVLSEAWSVVRTSKEQINAVSSVSSQPDKKEILVLMCRMSSGKLHVKSGDIVRDTNDPLIAGVHNAQWSDFDEYAENGLIGVWTH
jgi:hypothetical protein